MLNHYNVHLITLFTYRVIHFVVINILGKSASLVQLMQLRDEFGNAVEVADMAVAVSLNWPQGQEPINPSQDLPQIEMAERRVQKSDTQGRVFFGDIHIVEGSGHAGSGSLESSIELELLFSASKLNGYDPAAYQHLCGNVSFALHSVWMHRCT